MKKITKVLMVGLSFALAISMFGCKDPNDGEENLIDNPEKAIENAEKDATEEIDVDKAKEKNFSGEWYAFSIDEDSEGKVTTAMIFTLERQTNGKYHVIVKKDSPIKTKIYNKELAEQLAGLPENQKKQFADSLKDDMKDYLEFDDDFIVIENFGIDADNAFVFTGKIKEDSKLKLAGSDDEGNSFEDDDIPIEELFDGYTTNSNMTVFVYNHEDDDKGRKYKEVYIQK